MRILNVVGSMRKAAGTTTFIENVALGLRRRHYEVSVVTEFCALSSLKNYDLVHIHGLWSPLLHIASCKAHAAGIPIVWSPHGMLTKWALKNHWWKKWPFWVLFQKGDLSRANILHATAMSEVEDIRRVGLKNPVVIAPLGVDVQRDCEKKLLPHGRLRTLLFVSRIQRKKGLEMLLRVWPRGRGWRLRIVGPDEEGHVDELRNLISSLDIGKEIEFLGPKYGNELLNEYCAADCFILPSHSENFGSVVIEALAAGVPVITTKGTPWAELEEFDCGWWVDVNEQAIGRAVREMMALPNIRRKAMGLAGVRLVRERYTWEAVCEKLSTAYEKVVYG